MSPPRQRHPILYRHIASVFTYIGLFSIGGGVLAWVYRETVEKRRWVTDQEFFNGVALGQVMPGTNMINLVIYLGYLLRGAAGACVAMLSFSVLPTIVLTALFVFTSGFQELPSVQLTLAGVAAAAVGLSIATGIKVLRRSNRNVSRFIAVSIVVASLVFKVPTITIFVLIAPLSIFFAFKGYYD